MMETLEAIMWTGILRRAKRGDNEALETLQSENKVRQENGLPTVEEELQAMVETLQTPTSQCNCEQNQNQMKYLNQFHKESTEQCLKEMEAWSKQPFDPVKAAEQMKKNLAEAERLYPSNKNISPEQKSLLDGNNPHQYPTA